jgi:ABC-2 type transport system ATP-binding protein
MIVDILKPDTGEITVLGGKLDDARKDRLGYLPEERGLYRNVPVIEMMTYLGELKGMNHNAAKTRSMQLLEQLELGDVAKKKVSELSKGMQQKVQFAVTVLHNPDLIIVDEPFSGLDPVNTLVIKDLISDFRNNGGAVIMSTHQMYQVEEMANRLLMINKGAQALYGTVQEVRGRYALPALLVEGEGDWSALRTVDRVERLTDTEGSNKAGILLFVKDGMTTDDVLAEIVQRGGYHMARFEKAIPSLNDIFIRVAEGDDMPALEALEATA